MNSKTNRTTDPNPFVSGNNKFRQCLKGHVDYSASFDECPSCKIERNRSAEQWWCPECEQVVPPDAVTFWETHDERAGGCGHKVDSKPAPRASNLRVIEPFRSPDGVRAEVVKSQLGGTGCVCIEAEVPGGDMAEVTLNALEAHNLMLWFRCALGLPVETPAPVSKEKTKPLVTALIQAVRMERDEFHERCNNSYSTEALLLAKARVSLCKSAVIDEIERLEQEVRIQHAAYQRMFDKAAELERNLSGSPVEDKP